MECGHAFCNDCWRHHLRIQIQDGRSRRLPCMGIRCGVICDEGQVRYPIASTQQCVLCTSPGQEQCVWQLGLQRGESAIGNCSLMISKHADALFVLMACSCRASVNVMPRYDAHARYFPFSYAEVHGMSSFLLLDQRAVLRKWMVASMS